MSQIFTLLGYPDPVVISGQWISAFESGVVRKRRIWKPYSPQKRVFCTQCGHSHRPASRINAGNTVGFICPKSGRHHDIHVSDLDRWRLDSQAVVQELTEQLGTHGSCDEVVPSSLWRLGRLKYRGLKAFIKIFLCVKTTPSAISCILKHENTEPLVLLSVERSGIWEQLPLDIEVLEMADIQSEPMDSGIDQKYFEFWIKRRFSVVLFDHQTGDLIYKHRLIARTHVGTSQYFFLECLWHDFNMVVGHEEIFSFSSKRLAKRLGTDRWLTEHTPSTFCHTMKRLIKRNSKCPNVLDELIVAGRTPDEKSGYRLTAVER